MELALRAADVRDYRSSALHFFRVNIEVAKSEIGAAGIRDILKKWEGEEVSGGGLKKLEMAIVECRAFLRDLGKDFGKQRHFKEMEFRKNLQSLLLQIPEASEQQLPELQVRINEAARQLENLEEQEVKGHRVRAGLKWELEGDRPLAFFFQKLQEARAKKHIESLLDKEGVEQKSQ